jgi:uncharacterized protein (DUF2252 family)
MSELNAVTKNILSYNANRNENFIHLKYKALAESPHRFFRGTNHLFVESIAKEAVLKGVPFVWVCGDMHLENFGSFRGGNHLVYFDTNDFDEACVAPCTIDLVKLCVSIYLVGEELKFKEEDSTGICNLLLQAYKSAVLTGHASRLENATASGIIKTLFDKVAARKRKQFLKQKLSIQNGKVFIKTDFRRYYPLSNKEKQGIEKTLAAWVKENNRDKDFFTFMDAAFRIAGTGSLGLNRYCILVSGTGKGNYCLLDMKQAEHVALEKQYVTKQPKFKSPAHRIVQAQKRMNDTAPAGITTILVEKEYYLFKEHQPQEDKFSVLQFENEKPDFRKLVKELGAVIAWAQLRSSGLDGTSNGDDLIKFAQTGKLDLVIPCAMKIYKQTLIDYKNYVKDFSVKNQLTA